METQGHTRDVIFRMLAREHEETQSNLRKFGETFQSLYDAIDKMASTSAESRAKSEMAATDKVSEHYRSSFAGINRIAMEEMDKRFKEQERKFSALIATVNGQASGIGMTGTVSTVAGAREKEPLRVFNPDVGGQSVTKSRELEASTKAVDQATTHISASMSAIRNEARQWFREVANVKTEMQAVAELSRKLKTMAPESRKAFGEEAGRMHDEYRSKQEFARKREEEYIASKRSNERSQRASSAGLESGAAGYDQFMELGDKQQEFVLQNQQRMRARAADESRRANESSIREQERAAKEEESILEQRNENWRQAEEKVIRTRESAVHQQARIDQKLTQNVLMLSTSLLRIGRGFALMGLVGEENSQKLLSGLLKIQAGFDVVSGGIGLFMKLKKTLDLYHKSVELGEKVRRAEAAASEFARQKSDGLAFAMSKEEVRVRALAGAYADLRNSKLSASTAGDSFGVTRQEPSVRPLASAPTRTSDRDVEYRLAPVGATARSKQAMDSILGLDDGYRLAPATLRPGEKLAGGGGLGGLRPGESRGTYGMAGQTARGRTAENAAYFDAIGRPDLSRGVSSAIGGGLKSGVSMAAFETARTVAAGGGIGTALMAGGSVLAGIATKSVVDYGVKSAVGSTAAKGLAATGIGMAGKAAPYLARVPMVAEAVGAGMNVFDVALGRDPSESLRNRRLGEAFATSASFISRKTGWTGSGRGIGDIGSRDNGPIMSETLARLNEQDALARKSGRYAFDEAASKTQAEERGKTMHDQTKGIRAREEARVKIREEKAERDIAERQKGDAKRDLLDENATYMANAGEMDLIRRRRRREDRSTDDKTSELTSQLKKLQSSGGDGILTRGIERQLADIARNDRAKEAGRLSEGAIAEQMSLRSSTITAESERNRAAFDVRQLKSRRAGGDRDVSDADIRNSEAKAEAAEMKLIGLTRQRFDLERKIGEEKREGIEKSLDGIRREIEMRQGAADRAREKVQSAKERFGELDPEEQKQIVDADARIKAERKKIEETGISSAEEAEAGESAGRLGAVRGEIAQTKAALAKLGPKREYRGKGQYVEKPQSKKDRDRELALRNKLSGLETQEQDLEGSEQGRIAGRMQAQTQAMIDLKDKAEIEARIKSGAEMPGDRQRLAAIKKKVTDKLAASADKGDIDLVRGVGLASGRGLGSSRASQAADKGGWAALAADEEEQEEIAENEQGIRRLRPEEQDARRRLAKTDADDPNAPLLPANAQNPPNAPDSRLQKPPAKEPLLPTSSSASAARAKLMDQLSAKDETPHWKPTLTDEEADDLFAPPRGRSKSDLPYDALPQEGETSAPSPNKDPLTLKAAIEQAKQLDKDARRKQAEDAQAKYAAEHGEVVDPDTHDQQGNKYSDDSVVKRFILKNRETSRGQAFGTINRRMREEDELDRERRGEPRRSSTVEPTVAAPVDREPTRGQGPGQGQQQAAFQAEVKSTQAVEVKATFNTDEMVREAANVFNVRMDRERENFRRQLEAALAASSAVTDSKARALRASQVN